MTFYVKLWATGQTVYQHRYLHRAKKAARDWGHTGESVEILTGYPPVAYVANSTGEIVYNPRFGKEKA